MTSRTRPPLRGAAFALSLAGALAACSPPAPPEEERRPAPRADAQARPRSAIVQDAEAYKDRARGAEAAQLDAAERRRAEADAQSR